MDYEPDSPDKSPRPNRRIYHAESADDLEATLAIVAIEWAARLRKNPRTLEKMCHTIFSIWQTNGQLTHEMSLAGHPVPEGSRVIGELMTAILADGGMTPQAVYITKDQKN